MVSSIVGSGTYVSSSAAPATGAVSSTAVAAVAVTASARLPARRPPDVFMVIPVRGRERLFVEREPCPEVPDTCRCHTRARCFRPARLARRAPELDACPG
ncbi:Uncharacterised protein [Mycobacteroides abscessus]|nr:Uncharacterised protein [Mycobacteroides abscessus]